MSLERFVYTGGLFAREYVLVTPGWWRLDCATIMSGLVVRYYFAQRPWEHPSDPMEVSASRDGVCINHHASAALAGPDITEFIAVVRLAQRQHLRMAAAPLMSSPTPYTHEQDAQAYEREITS